MRVARRISDGRILEAQSNDAASMDSLKKNNGEEGIEFLVMDDAAVREAIAAQQPAPEKGALEKRLDDLEAKVKELEKAKV